MLSYDVSLRSEFRVIISVTISALKRCSVRLHLQLFVGGLMSYLRYLCLFAQSSVHPICKYVHCFEQNDNKEKSIGCTYTSFAVFSGVRVTRSLVLCFVDRCLSFCTFSFGHCVVCSSSIHWFWLPLWYTQTLLKLNNVCMTRSLFWLQWILLSTEFSLSDTDIYI